MTKLNIHGNDESKVNDKTAYTRHTDARTRGLVSNQVWTWEGGDAIVCIPSFCSSVNCVIVIRDHDTVRVVEARGLRGAFDIVGLDWNQYQVV